MHKLRPAQSFVFKLGILIRIMTAYFLVSANATATSSGDFAGYHYVTPQQIAPTGQRVLSNPPGIRQILMQPPHHPDYSQYQPAPIMVPHAGNIHPHQHNFPGVAENIAGMRQLKTEPEAAAGKKWYNIAKKHHVYYALFWANFAYPSCKL